MTVLDLTLARPFRPARPAPTSAGAHRLAWWLSQDDARWAQLAAVAGVSGALADRLLSGEVDPADNVAAAIARESEGEVLPEDWAAPATGGWIDRPGARA